ncbi:hypothetical protein POSPLADRAFT_1079661, partial [Postia placenta MAD-698-R-SB12]
DTLPSATFTAHTAFDAYFAHAARPARTSAAVFSHRVPALAAEEYAAALARLPAPRTLWAADSPARRALFAQWAAELRAGFNVLCHGYGSKRRVLNAFAAALARRRGAHVLVVNAFQPGFALRDLLAAIAQTPPVRDADDALPTAAAAATGIEAQTQRVYDIFSAAHEEDGAPRLYLVVHNVDGPGLRTAKARACLARLALAPRIHLVASIDHVAAPTRWTLAELFARKSDSAPHAPGGSRRNAKGKGKARAARGDGDDDDDNMDGDSVANALPRRGFAWLWHDLTTLAPYDFELAGADPASLSSAPAGTRRGAPAAAVGAPAGAGVQIVSESAARHVLASVTQKARKLFVLLGGKQLELMADGAAGGVGAGATGVEAAYDYARLFSAARDEFVATSDGALRALLAEFRDHGLVVSVDVPGANGVAQGEALWIPMRREALTKVVAGIRAE